MGRNDPKTARRIQTYYIDNEESVRDMPRVSTAWRGPEACGLAPAWCHRFSYYENKVKHFILFLVLSAWSITHAHLSPSWARGESK